MKPRPDQPPELGGFLLALRLAVEAMGADDLISRDEERELSGLANRAELAASKKRRGRKRKTFESELVAGLVKDIESLLGQARGRDLLDCAGLELEDESAAVVAAADPSHAGVADTATAAGANAGAHHQPAPPELSADAAEVQQSGRAIVLTMAVILVIGGAIALSFGLWRSAGDDRRYAFVGIPAVFCFFGWLCFRKLDLPRTGQALLGIALFLIPPVAVVSSSAPVWHAFVLFAVIAVLAATTSRLALRQEGGIIGVGIILFAGVTIFHTHVHRALDYGAIYLLASLYALVVGFDFIARFRRLPERPTSTLESVPRTIGILTYAVLFAIVWLLVQDQWRMREELQRLAPAALLVAAPSFFHGGLLYLRSPVASNGRLVGAILAFISLVSSLLSFGLTLLEGWPLFLWSAMVTPLCVGAAIIFRVRWAHVGAICGFVILYVTSVFLHAAGRDIDYPWGAIALDDLALRSLPLAYTLTIVALILSWCQIRAAWIYLGASIVVISIQAVGALTISRLGENGMLVAIGLAPVVFAIGWQRREPPLVIASTILAYLAALSWANGSGETLSTHALVVAVLAQAFVLIALLIVRAPHLERPLVIGSLIGAIGAVSIAIAGRALDPLYTPTGVLCFFVLVICSWRLRLPPIGILAFTVLYLTLLEAALRAFGGQLELLRSHIAPRAILAGFGLLVMVASARLRRATHFSTTVAAPAMQVSIGLAYVLGVAALDPAEPALASATAAMAALLFAAGALSGKRPTLWRPAAILLMLAGAQLALEKMRAAPFSIEAAHIGLAAFTFCAAGLRLIAWIADRLVRGRDQSFTIRSLTEISRTSGGALAFAVLSTAVAFFAATSEMVKDLDFQIVELSQVAIGLAVLSAALGLMVPRPIALDLPRGALVIAATYFLFMWLGVFLFDSKELLTYWQVVAAILSAIMAFGVGVSIPGVIPVSLITVAPAVVLAFVPPWDLNLLSCVAVIVAGLIYLKGAAAIESQLIYYLGTMTTTAGILLLVVDMLPGAIPQAARPVVIAATATMLAVWWTYCATRGWVRPVRFVRAALDSGLIASLIAALALVGYLVSLVTMLLAPTPIPVSTIPVPIRLAAIGVALSLVAYYVGAAAAFKSEFMVYVAEFAFFGAATLLRFGFRDLFKDETLRIMLPYLVIALGFVFAGISEFLERRGLEMFSRPLGNTGIFLPLISLLAMWFALTDSDFNLGQQHTPIIVGAAMALYFTASLLKRNRTLTLVVAVSFNLAVWFICDQFSLSLKDLPQLLAVPIGLSIVLAAQVNSDRLSPRVGGSLRYLGILVIYLSSAFKVFDEISAKHAVIMVVLSVLGVFAGLFFKVRAYVYIGITFLVMTIIAQIMHSVQATQEIKWGIFALLLGAALIVPVAFREHQQGRSDRDDAQANAETTTATASKPTNESE